MPTRHLPTTPSIRAARARLAAAHRWHPDDPRLGAARTELALAQLSGLGELAAQVLAQVPAWSGPARRRAAAALDLRDLLNDARVEAGDSDRTARDSSVIPARTGVEVQ